MTTLGLVLILSGFLLGRQVVVGRVTETPADLRDMTLAVLSGDFDALTTTLGQRGENVSPDVTGTVAAGSSGETAAAELLTGPLTGDLLGKMVELGSKATGYTWGATGPTRYDCSGLVWAAMRDLDIYKGPRFTTRTFVMQMGSRVVPVTNPIIGDIVLWPGKHIGVVAGNDKMYSAMSPQSGIGYSPIAASSASIGGSPKYYRLKDMANAVGSGDKALNDLLNPGS